MHILVITQMYSQPDDAGDNKPTKTVNYFVKEWAAMGHSVVVVHCPSKFPFVYYVLPGWVKERFAGRISTMVPPLSSRRDMEREENGVKVYRLPMLKWKPGMAYSPAVMQRQARRIEKVLERIRTQEDGFVPELVMGHFANPSLELTAILAEHYGAKSSIVFHHDCTDANIARYRIRENIGRIDAIGARSVIEAQKIKERLKMNGLPFVCCSGAPNDTVAGAVRICRKHDFSGGIRYLYVGSMIRRKNLDVVIRVFQKMAGEKDTLKIVGGGPEEKTLQQLAAGDDRIIFTGRIPREDVQEEMKKAHIFTLISKGETYGIVYIEAMLAGCLTIASKGEGFDGIIQDEKNGFLCAPGDSDGLQRLYGQIAAMTEAERNRIGQAAIDTAVHYSEREVAERYLEDVLDEK